MICNITCNCSFHFIRFIIITEAMSLTKGKNLFTMDLRLSNSLVQVPIRDGDTTQTIFQSLSSTYHISPRNKSIIIEKIIKSLQKLLSNGQMSLELKKKVKMFVHNNRDYISNSRKGNKDGQNVNRSKQISRKDESHIKDSHCSNNDDTPFKMIQNSAKKSCFSPPKISSPDNRHREGKCSSRKKNIETKALKASKTQYRKQDDDLLKAYETIMKKSKDPEMQKMAEQYLKQCGKSTQKAIKLNKSCELWANSQQQHSFQSQNSAQLKQNLKTSVMDRSLRANERSISKSRSGNPVYSYSRQLQTQVDRHPPLLYHHYEDFQPEPASILTRLYPYQTCLSRNKSSSCVYKQKKYHYQID